MARIPPLKRVLQEEFPDQPWLNKLLTPLNKFMESVVSAFNKSITVNDNMAGAIRTVEMRGTTATIPWSGQAPSVVIVGRVRASDNQPLDSTANPDAIAVRWYLDSDGNIYIYSIQGVTPTPSLKYTLTLLILV